MDSILVSIIIPFFNEEKYLSRAINSALNQSYDSIEIILVNDGSTDSSKEISEKFEKQYTNILCVHSVSENIGAARNKGLSVAKGTYLTFLDADDEFLPEMVETMLANIMHAKSDIVICKFDLIDTNKKFIFSQGFKYNSTEDILKIEACIGMYTHNIASTVWAKLYKADLAKSIKFPEGLWFEDRPYLLSYLLKSNKISFVEKSLLKIYSRRDSISRRIVEPKRIIDHHIIFEHEMNIVEQNKASLELSKIIVYHHLDVLVTAFFLLYIDHTNIVKLENVRKLFLEYISKYKEYYKKKGIQLTFKKKVLLRLIELPRVLPWKVSIAILKIVLQKKYKSIKILKTGCK